VATIDGGFDLIVKDASAALALLGFKCQGLNKTIGIEKNTFLSSNLKIESVSSFAYPNLLEQRFFVHSMYFVATETYRTDL
jgi:hypothetical protein